MNIKQCILTNNECYIKGQKIKPKGIMIHSTGANNPNLKRYVQPDDGLLGKNIYGNHWNKKGVKVCVHAFIGKDKNGKVQVYQTLPWDHRGWHCGRSGNDTHISFEICEDNLKDAKYFNEVYNAAVELCAYLCKEFKLTEKDVICHSEGYKLGIASNHSDVMHWFPKFGKDMDSFRADVKKALQPKKEPAKKETPKTTDTYTVKKGDTLSGIASKYGMALNDLLKLNPQIKNANLIHVGDKINIKATAKQETKPKETNKGDFEVKPYKNGSTKEYVYKTVDDCKKQSKLKSIGYLFPNGNAECYGIVQGCYLVVYTAGKTKKTGFVKYHGGVK